MLVVTGGAGFIGSALVWRLNKRERRDIIVVDRLDRSSKWKNLRSLHIRDYIDRDTFIERVRTGTLDSQIETIFHLGACSSTTEDDVKFLMENNYRYTRDCARFALERDIRFIYASSAATYGDGSHGYSDDHDRIPDLEPLNPYGFSKQMFDQHALRKGWLDSIVGLKYFNVYGPNEYHKGEMRSVVHKSVPQAREQEQIRLFKSHREDVDHGQQKRDFLYVKDAVNITLFFHDNPHVNGVYNVGTGRARAFDDLASAIFNVLDKPCNISYFDMPDSIRDNYQYFTEADLGKLRDAGYTSEFYTLEEGIRDYMEHYLLTDNPYLSSSHPS